MGPRILSFIYLRKTDQTFDQSPGIRTNNYTEPVQLNIQRA